MSIECVFVGRTGRERGIICHALTELKRIYLLQYVSESIKLSVPALEIGYPALSTVQLSWELTTSN